MIQARLNDLNQDFDGDEFNEDEEFEEEESETNN